MTASYNIGGTLGAKRTNTVQLKPRGAGCTMTTQTAYSGLIHNDAGDFVKPIKEALPESSPAKAPEPKPSESAKPGVPASAGTENVATVVVKSTPDGADVTVDGKFVGNTPSTLRLAPGDHTILVEKAGMKSRQRKMAVNAGSTVTIDAKLEQ